MIREWKKLENSNYLVSNDGKIVNKYNRVLKPSYDSNGYLDIKLSINKKPKHFKVHRLVAMLFIPNFNDKLEVNHLNGIKDDNRVENLEMCTRQENIYHSDYVLLNRIKKVYQYDLNGNFIMEWKNAKEIQKTLGYKQYFICRVCNNKRKTAYGFIWKYAKEANNEL